MAERPYQLRDRRPWLRGLPTIRSYSTKAHRDRMAESCAGMFSSSLIQFRDSRTEPWRPWPEQWHRKGRRVAQSKLSRPPKRPAASDTLAVIYLRPDGWWLAGDGFGTYEAALEAARREWEGKNDFGVIPSRFVADTLCQEALVCRGSEREPGAGEC